MLTLIQETYLSGNFQEVIASLYFWTTAYTPNYLPTLDSATPSFGVASWLKMKP